MVTCTQKGEDAQDCRCRTRSSDHDSKDIMRLAALMKGPVVRSQRLEFRDGEAWVTGYHEIPQLAAVVYAGIIGLDGIESKYLGVHTELCHSDAMHASYMPDAVHASCLFCFAIGRGLSEICRTGLKTDVPP